MIQQSQQVSFEWADGPNANAEFHRLWVFSPSGEKLEPRMQEIARHKNGQWSYSDQRVFVPSGSIVAQSDQSTHGSKSRQFRMWVAQAGRPEIFSHYGLWGSLSCFPEVEGDQVDQAAFEKMLRQIVSEKILAQWDAAPSVQSI